jgi:hypothetical protein
MKWLGGGGRRCDSTAVGGKEGFYGSAEGAPMVDIMQYYAPEPSWILVGGRCEGGLNSYDVPISKHDPLPGVFERRRELVGE